MNGTLRTASVVTQGSGLLLAGSSRGSAGAYDGQVDDFLSEISVQPSRTAEKCSARSESRARPRYENPIGPVVWARWSEALKAGRTPNPLSIGYEPGLPRQLAVETRRLGHLPKALRSAASEAPSGAPVGLGVAGGDRDVRDHDEDGDFEVDGPALAVGEAPVVHHPQARALRTPACASRSGRERHAPSGQTESRQNAGPLRLATVSSPPQLLLLV